MKRMSSNSLLKSILSSKKPMIRKAKISNNVDKSALNKIIKNQKKNNKKKTFREKADYYNQKKV